MTSPLKLEAGFVITDGPSREELFDALRLGHKVGPVVFKVHVRYTEGLLECSRPVCLAAYVRQIASEDGSGHSWNLRVQFYEDVDRHFLFDRDSTFTHIAVYYNDRTRRGAIVETRPSRSAHVGSDGTIYFQGREVATLPKHLPRDHAAHDLYEPR